MADTILKICPNCRGVTAMSVERFNIEKAAVGGRVPWCEPCLAADPWLWQLIPRLKSYGDLKTPPTAEMKKAFITKRGSGSPRERMLGPPEIAIA